MWSSAVHRGYSNAGVISTNSNGVNYGTYTWATDIGFDPAQAELLGKGSHAVDEDTYPPAAGVWGDDYFMSWHMNTTYGRIEVLIPDTREWRMLGHLLDEVEPHFGVLSKNDEYLELGYSLHSIQDMTGHGDEWVQFSTRFGVIFGVNLPFFKKTWNHGQWGQDYLPSFLKNATGADNVNTYYDKHGIRYYHWDDLIWARDLTYDVIGRYYKRFGG